MSHSAVNKVGKLQKKVDTLKYERVSPDTSQVATQDGVMLGVKSREEFRDKRLKDKTVELSNQSSVLALDVYAIVCWKITCPLHDLLRINEAMSPGHSRYFVRLGAPGQCRMILIASNYRLYHRSEACCARKLLLKNSKTGRMNGSFAKSSAPGAIGAM
jgi:hypothetical protein